MSSAQVFDDALENLLALLGLGDSNEFDSTSLYMFLESVEDLFEFDDGSDSDESEESSEESSGSDRRVLQQQPEQYQRQPRIMASTSTSTTSSTSTAKQTAALQNQLSTKSPYEPQPTVDISKLEMVLKALLNKLSSGRKLKMKKTSSYNTASGSFTIPKLALTVQSSIKFSVQENKAGTNKQASNSNSLVTKSVTFSASDGSTPVSISSLPNSDNYGYT